MAANSNDEATVVDKSDISITFSDAYDKAGAAYSWDGTSPFKMRYFPGNSKSTIAALPQKLRPKKPLQLEKNESSQRKQFRQALLIIAEQTSVVRSGISMCEECKPRAASGIAAFGCITKSLTGGRCAECCSKGVECSLSVSTERKKKIEGWSRDLYKVWIEGQNFQRFVGEMEAAAAAAAASSSSSAPTLALVTPEAYKAKFKTLVDSVGKIMCDLNPDLVEEAGLPDQQPHTPRRHTPIDLPATLMLPASRMKKRKFQAAQELGSDDEDDIITSPTQVNSGAGPSNIGQGGGEGGGQGGEGGGEGSGGAGGGEGAGGDGA